MTTLEIFARIATFCIVVVFLCLIFDTKETK